MNNQRPPGERRLFLVARATRTSTHSPAMEAGRRLGFATYVLVLPAAIFLVVVGIAAYLCLCGTWERAEDFILIFLPISCLLMGVAAGACFRS